MEENWEPYLRERFIDPGYTHAKIHQDLFSLDQQIYLTPNFDEIFENFVISETGGQVTVKRYSDSSVHNFLRDDRQHIIKVHGSVNHPEELIFTHHDYARARVKHSAFYSVLDACLLSHTFFIVGCGVSDPDLALLMENHRFNFPLSRPHYLVTSSRISPDMTQSLKSNRNLKCLTYNSREGHKELNESIEELAEMLDVARSLPTGA
ncbi:SIR2 family protein [Paracoccus sp. TK19116]|uniref:SIR2 family protein n=1 Tax=Paracoccus albicereus TaxID=2922394 RepID=A0ABT1MQJ1_9RHOB|nr:SIR2 family protein [Paracoccus albicereus]MCQ0970570.1 SIR2 family protein [Paracoccus albicereus]